MPSQTLLQSENFTWTDIVNPSARELKEIALKYGLHPNAIKDCLDPEHLPKLERLGPLGFLILRVWDEAATHEADTVQELTRKLAVFFSDSTLITIRRKEQAYFKEIKTTWQTPPTVMPSISEIVSDLIHRVITSYDKPIDDALHELDHLEMGVFEAQGAKRFEIKQGYFLKRKAFVYKRMLRMTADILGKIGNHLAMDGSHLQNLREETDASYFYADELTESTTTLLNLHLSLASLRTNEVVRVLTIFSVFLLPLNVITGIYGMNFEHMPELKWAQGYPFALSLMLTVLCSIYFWFKRLGWLK